MLPHLAGGDAGGKRRGGLAARAPSRLPDRVAPHPAGGRRREAAAAHLLERRWGRGGRRGAGVAEAGPRCEGEPPAACCVHGAAADAAPAAFIESYCRVLRNMLAKILRKTSRHFEKSFQS